MSSLTIGQVAKLAEIGTETIRFYERENLIPAPPRRPSGYRSYEPEVVDRIQFIRRAKDLGFSLREIAELLSLRVDSEAACGEVMERATSKIEDIQGKIKTLSRMKRVLTKLVASCGANEVTDCCPILDSLEGR